MSRPKLHNEPRINTAMRLPASLADRLRQEADARDVSISFLATRALEAYLDRLIPIDEFQQTKRK